MQALLRSWQTLHNQLHLAVMNVCEVHGLPGWPKSSIDGELESQWTKVATSLLESRGLKCHINAHWNGVRNAPESDWRSEEKLTFGNTTFLLQSKFCSPTVTQPTREMDTAEEPWSQTWDVTHATGWSFKEHTRNKAKKISALTHSYYRMSQMTQWYTVNDVILRSLYNCL